MLVSFMASCGLWLLPKLYSFETPGLYEGDCDTPLENDRFQSVFCETNFQRNPKVGQRNVSTFCSVRKNYVRDRPLKNDLSDLNSSSTLTSSGREFDQWPWESRRRRARWTDPICLTSKLNRESEELSTRWAVQLETSMYSGLILIASN